MTPRFNLSSRLIPCLLLSLLTWGGLAMGAPDEEHQSLRVYVGTYTSGSSLGIYQFELDLQTGKLTPRGVTTGVANPSFLAIHPTGRYLYSVNETSDFGGKPSGAVTSFSIDAKSGALTRLNQRPSIGAGPCHLVVDRSGRHVLLANYGGGSVAVLAIGDDGQLGETTAFVQHQGSSVDPQRQQGPHGHSINLDAANRFAFAADLGLDKILIYRFDAAQGTLTPNSPPAADVAPGSGPRHFAFHPDGRHAYVINEMSSTITAFSYDPKLGALSPLETLSSLPDGFEGRSFTAEVQVHPSGRFLYGSNRGHDSIAVFAIDPGTGKLSVVEHESTQGKTPRNFGIDPEGRYLLAANQNSDSIIVFAIDPQTGKLDPTGNSVSVPSPVCIKMLAPQNRTK